MHFLITYIVKLAICLAVIWLFYQCVLRRLTFYNGNRWFLLASTFFSFVMPLVDLTPMLEQGKVADSHIVRMIPVMVTGELTEEPEVLLPWYERWQWVAAIILIGALIVMFRFVVKCWSFYQMRRKAVLIYDKGVKVYQVEDSIIPFSFGTSIFINQQQHSQEELEKIISHEFVHVKQRHTLDIIWCEWLCIFSWYNPFAWLLKSAVRQNLEFIADENVLKNGVDKKQYQYLLLKVIGNSQFSIAPKFNFSSLKKRIAMMNKLKSTRLHLVKFLLVLPLLAIILLSFRKQIGDRLLRQQPSADPLLYLPFTDSVPSVTIANSKGYFIDVKGTNGNCIVVVKNKQGQEVERVLLTKWNDNESFYEGKYGELPPPPPPPPPPHPPVTPKLPANVESISVNNEKAVVILKNGSKEKYDLSRPEEREAFEKKYGKMPEPPVPPPPPPVPNGYGDVLEPGTTRVTDVSSDFEITNTQAIIHLKTGGVEKYDLTNKEELAKFEKKYGHRVQSYPSQGHWAPEVVVTGYQTRQADVAPADAIVVHGHPTDATASTDVKVGNGYRRPAAVAPTDVIVQGHPIAAIAPVDVIVEGHRTSAVAPADVTVVGDYSHHITGKEDIIITITSGTHREELEEFRRLMKDKGVDLKFDNVNFNDGKLVAISGSMRANDSQSNFSATDFKQLILAMIKHKGKTYFKVNLSRKSQVI